MTHLRRYIFQLSCLSWLLLLAGCNDSVVDIDADADNAADDIVICFSASSLGQGVDTRAAVNPKDTTLLVGFSNVAYDENRIDKLSILFVDKTITTDAKAEYTMYKDITGYEKLWNMDIKTLAHNYDETSKTYTIKRNELEKRMGVAHGDLKAEHLNGKGMLIIANYDIPADFDGKPEDFRSLMINANTMDDLVPFKGKGMVMVGYQEGPLWIYNTDGSHTYKYDLKIKRVAAKIMLNFTWKYDTGISDGFTIPTDNKESIDYIEFYKYTTKANVLPYLDESVDNAINRPYINSYSSLEADYIPVAQIARRFESAELLNTIQTYDPLQSADVHAQKQNYTFYTYPNDWNQVNSDGVLYKWSSSRPLFQDKTKLNEIINSDRATYFIASAKYRGVSYYYKIPVNRELPTPSDNMSADIDGWKFHDLYRIKRNHAYIVNVIIDCAGGLNSGDALTLNVSINDWEQGGEITVVE